MAAGRGSLVFAGLLVCGLAGVGFAQPVAPAKAPGGLPEGAVARLGKSRLRHADRATCAVFSPDGKSFITGGDDGCVRAWSVATGEQVNVLQKPGLTVAALQLTHGGSRLAVHFAGESVIRVLDPKSLAEVGTVPFVNRHRFAFSGDGKLLATSEIGGTAVVTEVERDLPKLELTGADVFDFRPDGKAIAVGDAQGNVTVRLVTGGKPVFAVKASGAVRGLTYSPDGKRLAVGWRSADGTVDAVRVYEGKDEKPVAEITGMNLPRAWLDDNLLALGNGTDAGVYDLRKKVWVGRIRGAAGEFAVSPDGTKLAATGNASLRVRLWDLTTGKQMHAENDSFPDPALMSGTPDGKSLFLLTPDSAYLWPVGADGAKLVGTLPGRAVAAATGGGTLIVATPDAVVVYTNFDPLKPLPAKPTSTLDASAGAKQVAVSPDGSMIAWALDGGKVTIADIADRKPRAELPITTTSVLALAFNPAGDGLAALGRDTFLRLWTLRDGEPKESWKARVGRGQRATIAFSPDGKFVAAASLAQVPVFDTATGDLAFKLDRHTEDGYAQHAAFSPDSRLLTFGSGGLYGRVEVWEVATRGLVRRFSTGYGGTSRLCVFPDGSRLASAGAEEAVTVWDLTYRAGKPAPKPDELLAAWNALASDDAAIGYPALKLLAAAGDRGTSVIARGTKDILATQRKINEWVEELGSQTFTIREVAAKELVAHGARARPAVTAATKSENPDIRDQAAAVLRKLDAKESITSEHGLSGDTLRLVRAVQALEDIGTAAAKACLGDIVPVGGAPATRRRPHSRG